MRVTAPTGRQSRVDMVDQIRLYYTTFKHHPLQWRLYCRQSTVGYWSLWVKIENGAWNYSRNIDSNTVSTLPIVSSSTISSRLKNPISTHSSLGVNFKFFTVTLWHIFATHLCKSSGLFSCKIQHSGWSHMSVTSNHSSSWSSRVIVVSMSSPWLTHPPGRSQTHRASLHNNTFPSSLYMRAFALTR